MGQPLQQIDFGWELEKTRVTVGVVLFTILTINNNKWMEEYIVNNK